MPTIQFFQPHEGRHFDGPLDLNEELVRHPAATFFMRAGADAREDGIRAGDLLVIDRALTPTPGSVVAAVRAGEIRLERFRFQSTDGEDADFWGTVTFLIRKVS